MSINVARTCTEITDSAHRADATEAKPLSEFRSAAAYVLLGDPGAGKTRAFQRESGELGDGAKMVSARDFLTFDVENRPEWWQKTLFIDGLDEERAGKKDLRSVLDDLRNRLDRLGRPRFRISCREADWLGHNDRQSLTAVSPDSRITVLRLDPLSEQAAGELLSTRLPPGQAQEFVTEARRRGIAALLDNPLTLILLAGAVGHGDAWPRNRLETFEMACKEMATEQNDGHRAGAAVPSTETVVDAAGHLCALQLLAGIEGYSLAAGTDVSSFVTLDTLEEAPGYRSRASLENALGTKLFRGAGDRTCSPLHRHVAEFLAGRYLAKLIRDGLPASRVVALMTGPSDGRVVTALRGLSAWLAAHPSEARRQLIDADPVGVGIYGDIADFTTDANDRLLRSLATFATQAPLFGHQWRDGRHDVDRYDTAWAFRSLVSTDMAPAITDLLNGRGVATPDDRIIEFVLDVLREADTSELESLPGLVQDLEAIMHNNMMSPQARTSALAIYFRVVPSGDTKTRTLTQLLDAIHDHTLSDPGDEIRGTLLDGLYPTALTPSQVWRYALSGDRPVSLGRLWHFWEVTLMERSRDQHVAELLDALHEDASRLIPAMEESQFADLPLRLLERGLEALGDDIEPSRLYNWLSATGRCLGTSSPTEESARRVRAWLEARREVQQAVFLMWLRKRNQIDRSWPNGYWRCEALHESRLPADFGLWCFEQALAIGDTEPAVSQELLEQAHQSLQDPSTSEGLTLDAMRERTRGQEAPTQLLEELSGHRPSNRPSSLEASSGWLEERREQAQAEKRQRREEWATLLRSHEAELRANKFSPENLGTLAKVYFGLFVGLDRDASHSRRIGDFIGDGPSLVDAVLAALRGAVTRDDVPEVDRTISLRSESRHSWLAYPVLASLHLLDEDHPARLDGLDKAHKRNALAIYYCVPLGHECQPWHDRWLRQDPNLVLDVLYRCAAPAVRAGEEAPPGLNDLDRATGHDDLVHDVRLRLLRGYPTRGPNKQLPLLDRLLTKVLKHPDKATLQALVDKKLSLTSMSVAQRVRWLAVDALISPCPRLGQLKAYVGESDIRARHLAEFLRNSSDRHAFGGSILTASRTPATLRDTIEMIGRSYGPTYVDGLVTLEMDTSDRISALIRQLGSLPGDEAQQALTELIDDPQMVSWRSQLTWALERQRVVHRDASYRHPTIEQVQRTLNNRAPANASDLAALLNDQLNEIAQRVRGSNSNLWRQFWNEDPYGRPSKAKPEESCRDVLVEALQTRLPPEVDAAPEGRYASGKRADIRASCGEFNVPIEIKKNSHLDLWSALREQLIGRYTTDPATSGHGIFLVLWFGANETRPQKGNRPTTPEELSQRLEKDLTSDEARKISVVVMDVTKPGDQPTGDDLNHPGVSGGS